MVIKQAFFYMTVVVSMSLRAARVFKGNTWIGECGDGQI